MEKRRLALAAAMLATKATRRTAAAAMGAIGCSEGAIERLSVQGWHRAPLIRYWLLMEMAADES